LYFRYGHFYACCLKHQRYVNISVTRKISITFGAMIVWPIIPMSLAFYNCRPLLHYIDNNYLQVVRMDRQLHWDTAVAHERHEPCDQQMRRGSMTRNCHIQTAEQWTDCQSHEWSDSTINHKHSHITEYCYITCTSAVYCTGTLQTETNVHIAVLITDPYLTFTLQVKKYRQVKCPCSLL